MSDKKVTKKLTVKELKKILKEGMMVRIKAIPDPNGSPEEVGEVLDIYDGCVDIEIPELAKAYRKNRKNFDDGIRGDVPFSDIIEILPKGKS
jgi:hypothetical protein